MGPLLYSLVRFVKPSHCLEIGAGRVDASVPSQSGRFGARCRVHLSLFAPGFGGWNILRGHGLGDWVWEGERKS